MVIFHSLTYYLQFYGMSKFCAEITKSCLEQELSKFFREIEKSCLEEDAV